MSDYLRRGVILIMGRERRWAGSASDDTQNNGNEESLQENIDYL